MIENTGFGRLQRIRRVSRTDGRRFCDHLDGELALKESGMNVGATEDKKDASFLILSPDRRPIGEFHGLLHFFEHTVGYGENRQYAFWHGIAQLTLGEGDLKLLVDSVGFRPFVMVTLENGRQSEALALVGHSVPDYFVIGVTGLNPFTQAQRIDENK